jgi:membrane protein YqaA with SNARE-associated domain
MKKNQLNNLTSNKYFIVSVFIISLLISFAGFYFRDFFAQSRGLGLLGIFIINFFSSATLFISGPAFLTIVAGGDLYNPLLVALVASMAASLGDLVSFFMGFSGRKLTYERLERKKWFTLVDDIFKRHGIWVVFVFSIIPNPFFDAIGLIAGVFGIKPVKFFLVMFLGRFLRFVLLAFIGAKFY